MSPDNSGWDRPARLGDLSTEQLRSALEAERHAHPRGSPRLRQLSSLLSIRGSLTNGPIAQKPPSSPTVQR